MITPHQVLVTMYSFRGINAKKNVKKVYNDYAEKHHKDKVSSSSAWCSETIMATFIKLGGVNLMGGLARYSGAFVRHFKAIGIWKGGHDRIPNPGDIAIFQDKNGKPNHTEMVISVNKDKGTFFAVSGNYLGNVGTKTRKIHGSNIHGYGCPKYDTELEVTPKIVEKVLSGKYGKGASFGSARYNKLAIDHYNPNAVQDKVNWVIKTAKAIKDGDADAVRKYGNDQQRKDALGKWYDTVQKQINVLYGIDSWEAKV